MFRLPKLFVLATLALAGCGAFGSACEVQYRTLCDICPKDDDNAALCKCLDEGVLTKDDGPDGRWDSNDEAQQDCDRIRFGLHYQSDESTAECRANNAYLSEWGVDACADFGFEN